MAFLHSFEKESYLDESKLGSIYSGVLLPWIFLMVPKWINREYQSICTLDWILHNPFLENVGLFPAGLVASSSATRARTRTTDQPSNKYWTLLLLKQDFHNSFHNCSKDRESVRYYDGSRRNRMLQHDENDCYWFSLSLRRKSFAIYWHWYSIDVGVVTFLMIMIGRRWWQGW